MKNTMGNEIIMILINVALLLSMAEYSLEMLIR